MKVLIACGGTGGHIYPAIAIAKELKDVVFVGGSRLEKELVPRAGFRFIEIPASPRKLGLIIQGFLKSRKILQAEKPELILSTGGYVTIPVILAAYFKKIPIFIQEQNILPGKVNRLASLFAKKIFIAFAGAQKYFPKSKTVVTGNPIRSEIAELTYNNQAEKILIFGGSLAAKSINDAVYPLHTEPALKDKLIHLDGKIYCHDMAEAYRQSALVICRAGATTLSELAAIGLPAILIPYPHAANDHQKVNARYFEKAGAAKVILDKDLSPKKLKETILALLNNKEVLAKMSAAMKALGTKDSAKTIADQLS